MKADHHQSSASLEMRHTLWQDPRKLFELTVEINPYSLKGACRRVLPCLTGTYRFTNQLDELPRGMDGFDCARSNNRSCNLLSKPFFAVITYHLRQKTFIHRRQPLRCGDPAADIHAHIPVSYTHLRAHETRHDLVCRLLLEKKK